MLFAAKESQMTIVNKFNLFLNFVNSEYFILVPVTSGYEVMDGFEVLNISKVYQDWLFFSYGPRTGVLDFDFTDPNFHAYMKHSYNVDFWINSQRYLVYKVSNIHDMFRLIYEEFYI